MGFLSKLFGIEQTGKDTSIGQQKQPVLSLSLRDKYSEDRPNKTFGPYVKRGGAKDFRAVVL